MLLQHKQLVGLLVETQSGEKLGRVDGFNLETDAHFIHQYLVKPAGLSKIFSHELIISRNQVISLSAEKMVVDDLVYKTLAKNIAGAKPKNPLPAEAATTSNR
ncbi:MAG: hypothetical protein AAB779_00850 [Patescibacteria group bacterium]